MADRIGSRVAQILTARELVINRGTVEGVAVGMRFAVLNRRGTDIRDPDTGDVLGSVELEKVLVKVVRVDEHLAVARTFRTFTVAGGGATGLWALVPRFKAVLSGPFTRLSRRTSAG